MNIYHNEGLRGYLKGYQAMILRDVPGFAVYFMTYEFLKRSAGVSEADKGSSAYNQKTLL